MNSRRSNYAVLEANHTAVLLRDLGPWDVYLSITNDAENVLAEIEPVLNGRRVFYLDSENELAELKKINGRVHFLPVRKDP
jgi:hypothetical protein